MKELKADEIRTNSDVGITYDKGTTSLCFMVKDKNEVCVGDGAAKEIHPADKQRFYDAYKYLHEMVDKKTGKDMF